MNRLLFILLLSEVSPLFLFAQGRKQEVIIEIKSSKTNLAIEAARVEIKGYGETESDAKGKAWFPDVPEGSYKVQVYKPGYENLVLANPIKVTSSENLFFIELTSLPPNSFLIRGQIQDLVNGNPLDSVQVFLVAGDRKETTQSNEWGYYDFKFNKNDVENSQKFILIIRRHGYETPNPYEGGFFPNYIDVPVIKLKKIKIESPIQSRPIQERTLKSPMLSIGVAPDANFFLNGNLIQVQGTSSFALRWNISKKRKLFTLGIGWHLPIDLKTQNSFQTLVGMTSDFETKYKISSLGFVSFRYYHKMANSGIPYFIGITGLFVNQKPIPAVISQENHEAEISSYYKFVPRLNIGISISKGIFEFEPFLSLTYFKLNTQNLKFNYFGRADYEIVDKKFIQIGIGFNLEMAIINY